MRKNQRRKDRRNVREAPGGKAQSDKSYRTQENSVKAIRDLHEDFLVIRLLWVNKRLAAGEMQEQVWVIL